MIDSLITLRQMSEIYDLPAKVNAAEDQAQLLMAKLKIFCDSKDMDRYGLKIEFPEKGSEKIQFFTPTGMARGRLVHKLVKGQIQSRLLIERLKIDLFENRKWEEVFAINFFHNEYPSIGLNETKNFLSFNGYESDDKNTYRSIACTIIYSILDREPG